MRSLLLASTFSAAHSMAISAGSKRPAVQSLMESAKGMLKDGATPEVSEFADRTLEQVIEVVVPAIIAESENDEVFLKKLKERFIGIREDLETGNAEIHQLNLEEKKLSADHKACREDERAKCYDAGGKRECEKALYGYWVEWVNEEDKLKDIHDNIHGHFCPPEKGGAIPNGTTHEFRVTSVPSMDAYMKQKIVADKALEVYDGYISTCVKAHNSLDAISLECNKNQTDLEEKACAHRTKIHEVATAFWGDYAQAEAAYNCAEEEVRQLEKDRHKEYVTLQVVKCLLEEVHNQNGVPCDTATNTVEDRVANCEEKHGIDVCKKEPRLCITDREVDDKPEPCKDRDSVEGYCIAGETPAPCCGAWEKAEITPLPDYPVAPFSHENPGCNAHPDCVACEMEPMPEYKSVDTCPGYTLDGCNTDGKKDEHPLTLIRSVDGLADVRCCADVPKFQCKSQGFEGGVDFLPPNAKSGDEHTQCYFDVTYQEALSVCHKADMRICTHDEMETGTCCGTGCWHNHHAIWVDVSNPMDLDRPQVYSVTHEQHVEQRQNRDDSTHKDYQKHREGIQDEIEEEDKS